MKFIEPVVVLVLMCVVYGALGNIHWKTRRRILWLSVAAILILGVLGALTGYYRLGGFSRPASPE